MKKDKKDEDIICPVCGYYCLGKGGIFCIDKPSLVKIPKDETKIADRERRTHLKK